MCVDLSVEGRGTGEKARLRGRRRGDDGGRGRERGRDRIGDSGIGD